MMALLFLDSFDHYSASYTGGIAEKYTGGSATIGALYGRHGNGAIGNFYTALPAIASSTSIIGAAVWFDYLGGSDIFGIGDVHPSIFYIDVLGDGHIRTSIGDRSSPPDTIRAGQWFYIEMQTTVSVAAGSPYNAVSIDACQVWVDGLLVIDETALGTTGPLTHGTSTYGWNMATFGGHLNATKLDDIYVCDGSGPAPWNAPLGDVEIGVIRPNGVGASTEWTAVGSAANWSAVDDSTPDDETTHVLAATAGLSDLYAMEDINTSDGIIGAQLLISSRRTDEGFAQLTPLLRHAGTTTELVTRSISPSYFYRNRDCFVTMPNGDPLTDANVNALQAGVRRTS